MIIMSLNRRFSKYHNTWKASCEDPRRCWMNVGIKENEKKIRTLLIPPTNHGG